MKLPGDFHATQFCLEVDARPVPSQEVILLNSRLAQMRFMFQSVGTCDEYSRIY